MTHLHSVRGGVGGGRPQGGKPQLPAFCRTRRPTTTVYVSGLRDLYRLLLLLLAFQLSTLLLVIAGPVPPRLSPSPAPSRTLITAAAGMTATESIPVTPHKVP
ncbi:hypothetical protein H6G65_15640 [Microcystis elabens FACHB-917]|nr:hypothetical protein [Microcystis elabens FACHB-917]